MPSRYDLRSASLPAYRTFGQRADEVAGLLGNLGRGAGYTALDLLGTASDLGLTVTDLLGVTDPAVPRAQMIGTGDWLIDRAADAGLVQPRTGEGAETAGRFLGQVAIPGVSPAEMAGWAKVLPFLLGTFKGMNANLSDDETRMLQKAFELEQQGLGREAIRQATNPPGGSGGWARAPWDQKWRIEMDDSQARMTDEAIGLWGAQNLKEGRTAQQVFEHPALYQAYPALADVPVSSTMPRGLGTASWLGMKQGVQLDPDFLARFSARNPGEISRAMLHELGGHGVQSLEGFTPGSSALLAPDNARQVFGPTMEKLNDMLVQGGAKSDSLPMWDDIPMNGMSPYTVPDLYQKFELTRFLKNDELPAYEKLLGELEAAAPKYRGPNENYLLAGGEAESRLIEARRKLTPAQRAALDPYEQMDTMLKQEGFPGGISELRGGLLDEGPQMSIADGLLGRHVELIDQPGGVLGKTSLEQPQDYPLAKMQRWPIQEERGLLDVPTSQRADKYEGLSPEGVKFIKQFEGPDFRNKTAIHYNNKTGLSLDFSTSCTKRHGGGCNAGACAYCYVEHERTFKEKMGITGAKAKKLVENDYEGELMRMPAEVVTNLNRDGGMRMFSFGDFRPGIDDANVERVLEDARKRGLYIKAITKEPELIAKFGDHPNFRANLSIDYLPRDASNSWTVEDAIKAKAGRENIKLRGVALNMEEAERMAKDKRIDVITLYHGPTGDRAFNMIKEQNPKLVERFGSEDALRAETARWENMAPRNNNVKEFMERNKGRVCCQGGKCSTDPKTKCGFASKAIGALLPGVFVAEWFDEGVPEDF